MAVYDDEKTKTDDLHKITGISPSEARDMEARAVAGADQDKAAANEKQSLENNNDTKSDDTVGKGFTDSKKPTKGRISKKKASIIGVLTGGIIGGGLFGFSIIQGPMQLVHLSQVLQVFNYKRDNDINVRTGAWYRFWKSGEYGETRVSMLGSKLVNKRMDELRKMGIEFDTDRLGNIRTISFDTDKLSKERNAELSRKDTESAKRILAQEFDLPEEDFRRVGTRGADGHRFVVQIRGQQNINQARETISKVVNDPDKTGIIRGKAYGAMTERAFKKFYNLPSLYSPLKRLEAKADQRAGIAIDRKERKDREKERTQRVSEGAEHANPGARKKLSEKLSGNTGKVAGGALVASAGMCFVRDISEDIVEANRAAVVAPALLDATDKKAVGSQVQSNQNIDMDAAGDVADSLVDDDGKTIWQGTALQAISSGNYSFDPSKDDPNDLPPEYKQAFSNNTTSNNIKETIGGNSTLASAACSPVGQGLQIVGSLALLAAGPLTGGGSWAAFAAKAGAGATATAFAMHFIEKIVVDNMSIDDIDVTSLPSPVRGNLLAYGAREAANTAARSNGGIELSKGESDEIDREVAQLQRKEFKQKKLIAQLFDMNDYRSVASQASMSLSPSVIQNISTVASNLTNYNNSFSTISSVFTPKTSANERTLYSWDFELFGIPKKILEDPRYENPYRNADVVTDFLNEWPLDTYKDKVKTCFGVTLDNESGQWDITPENEVNPNSQKYTDAKCNNTNDELWVRIMLFVFDLRHLAAAGCLELDDDEACSRINMESVSAPAPESPAVAGGSLESNKDKFTSILKLPEGAVGPPEIGFYHQCNDNRWSGEPYPYVHGGSNTICASACGPTSIAMIVSTIGNEVVNPKQMSQKAKQWHVSGGTAMSGAISLVDQYGLRGKKITASVSSIKSTLESGGFVIMNANAASPFTQAGHFVVIRGISSDGSKFYVADPADDNGNGQNRNEKAWPTSSISGWLGPDGLYAVGKK